MSPKLAGLFMIAATAVAAAQEQSTADKLEQQYFKKLDDWVARGGPVEEVQGTVVETCGKLVILTASTLERVTLPTTQREEFHFRVDVCTKMTAHRVYSQPEFEDKDTVALICDRSKVSLFPKLCKRSKLR